jgi:hypothetical protein
VRNQGNTFDHLHPSTLLDEVVLRIAVGFPGDDVRNIVTQRTVATFISRLFAMPNDLTPGLDDDLFAYVQRFGGGAGEAVTHIIEAACTSCDSNIFWMQCSEEDGVANRTCTVCKASEFIGDSELHWDEADTGDATCPCKKKVFRIALGYCADDDDDVTWMIVGAQCMACHAVGVYADWSVEHEPLAMQLPS